MRLGEEKNTIIIEIVILIFITLASLCLQIIDAKIKDYNDKLSLGEVRRSHYLQLSSYYSEKVDYYELTGLLSQLASPLGKNLMVEDDPIADPENVGDKYKELMSEYKNKKIDAQTYITKMGNLSREKVEYYKKRVRDTGDAIKNMRKVPPKLFCFSIFSFQRICFIIQFVGAIFAIGLYVHILRQINQRTTKK